MTLWVDYSYQVDGRMYSGEAPRRSIAGERFTVYYDPDYPGWSRLGRPESPGWAAIVAALLFIAGIVVWLRQALSSRAEPPASSVAGSSPPSARSIQ